MTLVTPLYSTAANPCMRNADKSSGYASDEGHGLPDTALIVPLTRGSSRKFLPVIWETALITDSISALTKFSVTLSSAAPAGRGFALSFAAPAALAGPAAMRPPPRHARPIRIRGGARIVLRLA